MDDEDVPTAAPRPPHVTRRALIGTGVAGALTMAGTVGLIEAVFAGNGTATPAVAATGARTAARHAAPTGVRTGAPRPAVATAARSPRHHAPAWTRRWSAPIRTITDFQRRSERPHYAGRAVMLTIDDGPDPAWTPAYLALLERYGITATFCMIGLQVRAHPHLAAAVADRGHVIANHTWSHDEGLEYRPASVVRSDIERTNAEIHTATGRGPTQFRAPGGTWGPQVFGELVRHRMMPLGWSVDPRDWARPGAAQIEAAVLAAGPRDIVLCHDGGGNRDQTYAALRQALPRLLDQGYVFVTLPASAG